MLREHRERPWRVVDYVDKLPAFHQLSEDPDPDINIPEWAEQALVACIILLALAVLLAAILPGILDSHAVVSK